MKEFSFVGWSGSGKTTLITRLVTALTDKGGRVVCVKRADHAATLEPEGKDTARFVEAGAESAFLVADGELVRMQRVASAGEALEMIAAEAGGADWVLLEGAVREGAPVIEVLGPDPGGGSKFPAERLAAVVGSRDPGLGVPFFASEDVDGLVAFMEGFYGQEGVPQGR
jgi:molybdopterin-guanine dinucleotide biosynthesis protein B